MIKESKLYKHDDCTSCGEKDPAKLVGIEIGRSQCGIRITLCTKCYALMKQVCDNKFSASEVQK
jgi:hypothetical protein